MGLGVHVKNLFTSIFNAVNILAYVDGQTEAILSSVVSIDAIVDSDGSVATGSPLHSACLGAGPGWVRTPVLSMSDPEVRVIGLDFDPLDGLDRVRDVRVVDERTVPNGGAIRMTSKMKIDEVSLFFQEVDKFDIAVLAKVPFQPLLAEGIEVLDVSNVHVPRCTRVDRECESGRKWAGVLTPANLQPTVVEGQALEGSDLVEGHGSRWVNEGDELSK